GLYVTGVQTCALPIYLGESDRGVIMMRRKLVEQAELVARGGEPKAVIRDIELNRCVRLPIIDRERYVNGVPRAQMTSSEIQRTRSEERRVGQEEMAM